MQMSQIGEKGFIENLPGWFPDAPFATMLDDAAEVALPGMEGRVAFSIDRGPASIARKWGYAGREADGRLAAVATISDLLASGAKPLALTLAINAPIDASVDDLRSILEGFHGTCRQYGANFVGGDTKLGEWNLVSSGIGALDSPIQKRQKGQPGDYLVVTGPVGRFLVSSLTLLREQAPGSEALDAQRYLSFPEVSATCASWVQANLEVRSATDASDGLFDALVNVVAPKFGFEITADALPLDPEDAQLLAAAGLTKEAVLSSGGDWNTVYAVSPTTDLAMKVAKARNHGLAVNLVGVVTKNPSRLWRDGHRPARAVKARRSDHFKDRIEDVTDYLHALRGLLKGPSDA
jgi:thiamine-monophosphate kinase